MTTRKRAAAAAAYDPAKFYLVQLTKPVPLPGGRQLLPAHGQRIKGSVLATIPADAVASSVEHVPAPTVDQVEG